MVIFNHCAAPVLALPLQRQCAMIILFKDNANRAQWQRACSIALPRCRLSYSKIMQIERNGNELARLHCQDAAYLIQR